MERMKKEKGPCAHKKIKHFDSRNVVLCLDCGEEWKHGAAPSAPTWVWVYPQYHMPVYQPPIWIAPPPIWIAPYTNTGDYLPQNPTITCGSSSGLLNG